MAGYTRQSTFTDGDIINAADSNDEFNQLINAFSNTTGHAHDGTAAEGPVIGLIGDPGVATPINKVVVDDTNNQIEFNIDVSGTSTEQFVVKDGVIEPTTDNDIDLGSTSKEFKNLYLDGTATIDGLAMPTTTVTDILDEDTMSSDSATALATQQSIKAYVDAQVTAQDLDFQADSGGALNIDLDSESLTFTGGSGIDTSGAGNTVTFAIDSTVATLTGTQTLTNKTLTSAVLNGTISGTSIKDEDTMSSDSADHLATQQSIKAYVDAQVATKDALSELSGDSDDITEGTTNLFFTNERVDDRVDSLLTAGTNITLTYDDTANTLTIASTDTGITDVVDDTTPQLGGDLDVNGQKITSASNGDIDIEPNGTGNVLLGNFEFDVDQTVGAGQDNYVLTYDNSTGHISLEAAAAAGISDVVDDTTPQLGGDLDVNTNNISFGDSATAGTDDTLMFGAGDDLKLYHDGTHSYIHDSGTGDLRLRGSIISLRSENNNVPFVTAASTGVTLTHSGATKLTTVSTGVDVTGSLDVSDASTTRTNLGLAIGSDVQAYDAELAALAGLTSAADKGIQFTGSGTAATYDLTAAGKALLDDASASAQRTTLGLGTAATQDTGTSASNVVQLDGSARLPAVDGSQLTNLPASGDGGIAMAIALG